MTTAATMNRKRPSPGSNTPIQIASTSQPSNSGLPATSASAYLNSPTSSAAMNQGNLPATAGQYGHHMSGITGSPTTAVDVQDMYNMVNGNRMAPGAMNSSQVLNLALNDNNQVARITNRTSSLMRISQNQNNYYSQGAGSGNLGNEASHHSQMTAANATATISTGVGGGGSGVQAGNTPNQMGMNGHGLDMYGDLAPLIRKAKGKKPNIPPFVQKLSQFVNDPKCDHLIRWSPSGNSFLVLDEDEFSKTLIPDLFKHNNYASFVRQLNMYGFHKVVGLADGSLKTSEQRSKPPSEYKNQYFIRGMPDLMWLIQKPKNTTKRKQGGRKKGKAEDSDDDNGSDAEVIVSGMANDDVHLQSGNGGGTGGYIEGPPSQHVHHPNPKADTGSIMLQLEQLKQNQTIISNALTRLRKDNNHLYEQSIAFQTLHERHETSITAILTFLATVYDKTLIGHVNSQTLSNLFQGAVDASQNGGQVVGNQNNQNGARSGVIGAANGQPRTPFKRRPLMLPPVPQAGSSSQSEEMKMQNGAAQGPQQQQQQHSSGQGGFSTYQSPSIQEVFTPASGPMSPGSTPQSPTLGNSQLNNGFYSTNPFAHLLGHNDQQPHMGGANTQGQLASRILRRAMTPFLPASDSSQALHQHQNKIVDTRAALDHVRQMQEQQNDQLTRLMEIVGPSRNSPEFSSRTLSSPSSKLAKGIAGRLMSNIRASSSSDENSNSAGGAVINRPISAVTSPEDPQIANLSVSDRVQTPPNTNSYIQAIDGGGNSVSTPTAVGGGVSGVPETDFGDIDQFLQASEWLPEPLDSMFQQQQQQQQQVGVSPMLQRGAGAGVSVGPGDVDVTVGLDPLFLDDAYANGGYELAGLGMMGQDGGLLGGPGGGQILGHSIPSTAVGSPSSPSGGGYPDGLGIGEGMVITDEGSVKKKRRTG